MENVKNQIKEFAKENKEIAKNINKITEEIVSFVEKNNMLSAGRYATSNFNFLSWLKDGEEIPEDSEFYNGDLEILDIIINDNTFDVVFNYPDNDLSSMIDCKL